MPIIRLTLLTGICLIAAPAGAQNDVFGNLDPFGQQLAADAQQEASDQQEPDEVNESPLRRQLLEHAGRGEIQLADAIAALARTDRWSDVDKLLPQVTSADTAVLAEMAQRIGPAILLRIKQSDQLSDSARSSLRRLEKAAIEYAESRDRLRAAIDQLDSPSIDARLAAMRLLLGGGNAAISELVAAAVSENPTAPQNEILAVMQKLGPGGAEALRQLALYGTPPVRNRAMQALGRIDRRAHLADFVAALYAADASRSEVATATANLQRLDDDLPSLGSTLEFLTHEFQQRRLEAQSTDNSSQRTTIWNVDEDRTGVTFQPTGVMFSAYRRAVDAGARLRRIGQLPPSTLESVLAADLAYRVVIDVDWGDADQIAAVRAAYGDALTASTLSSAIGQSIERGDHAAAIGLIRMIESQSSAADRDVLLGGSGSSPTPLVAAASSPDLRVRYEAALAVSRLADGRHQYPGSSRVMHCLSEMHSLDDRATAILVETRPDVSLHLETLLRDIGFRVRLVGTVADLQRLVSRGSDLRIILSKTELADLPAIEMVDLVRRLDRGREVPIVFYGADPGEILRARRWAAPTVLIDRPISDAALVGMFDAAAERRRLPALSIIDRQRYRDAASEFLSERVEVR